MSSSKSTLHRNSVELVGTYGNDTTHAMSAWTSTYRELTEERKGRIPELLKMLAENGHHTPFEKSSLHFVVVTDIATHIHLIKHRIGVSVNAESARYRELQEDKFYVPQDWPVDIQDKYILLLEQAQMRYHELVNELVAAGVKRSRAKESARFVLPYGNQIKADVMFNFRSFMLFEKLRNDSHAQLEVRTLAQEMLKLVRDTGEFDASLIAFGY